ncbi:uncharacterized protein LOC121406810 [Lytechinus variegatus]|uniref:uncharacterized protein LOC121406808 n=1 Tax=Lytechinus variegatus TaxID=7654 RepID=UPI001BB17199|nr:uncharacterized protein LOC121406808 [Lytechinus variegatus]XP_041453614.1 uncharacterized protein LOC121406810 [Lytechinus variegatus]
MSDENGKRTSIQTILRDNFTKISEQIEEFQMTQGEWRELMKSHKEYHMFDNIITMQPEAESKFSMGCLYFKALLWFFVSLFLTVFFLFALFSNGVISEDSFLGSVHYHISKFYVETYDGAFLDKEHCIMPLHEVVQDLFRPPILNCSMCAGMTSVDIRTNLTTDEFKAKYAYSSRPLLVTDGMDGWTALDTFSFQFFQEVYAVGSKALKSAEDDCQFFPYKTDFEKLGDVFNMTVDQAYLRDGSNSKPWYIGWYVDQAYFEFGLFQYDDFFLHSHALAWPSLTQGAPACEAGWSLGAHRTFTHTRGTYSAFSSGHNNLERKL